MGEVSNQLCLPVLFSPNPLSMLLHSDPHKAKVESHYFVVDVLLWLLTAVLMTLK